MEKLDKMSISNLAFFTLNPNVDIKLKCAAERKLKERTKTINCDLLLSHEKRVLDTRGYDIKNYLIDDNPNMQLFMELFFNSHEDKEYSFMNLLYSENHIYNDVSVLNDITKKIILAELKNVKERYVWENSSTLIPRTYKMIIDSFAQRVGMDLVAKKQSFSNYLEESTSLNLWESFCFESSDGLMPLELLENFETYSDKYPIRTKLLEYVDLIYINLEDALLSGNSVQDLMIHNEVRKDSNKLNPQKKLLLNQAKSGYRVDYSFLERK